MKIMSYRLSITLLCFTATISLLNAATGKYITYEQFGAVGDGIHDDQAAIIAAHQAANEQGLPVRAADGKTYYIGRGDKVAVIKTQRRSRRLHCAQSQRPVLRGQGVCVC